MADMRPLSRQPSCPCCDHEHHEFTRCEADLGGALCPCPPKRPTGIYDQETPMITSFSVESSSTWNGGVCPTCSARYLGSHTCSPEDIARRIAELEALMPKAGRS